MEDKNKRGIFHFEDNDDEDYEFVLPPEYKIDQDSYKTRGDASIDERSRSLTETEIGDAMGEKKVSFNTNKNEYYYVERHSDQEEAACFGADDEFRPKDFEIEILPDQELVEDKNSAGLAVSGMGKDGVSIAEREMPMVENSIVHESEMSIPSTSASVQNGRSCSEAVALEPLHKSEELNKVPNDKVSDNKVPDSNLSVEDNSLQQIIDNVSEFISNIKLEGNRLKNSFVKVAYDKEESSKPFKDKFRDESLHTEHNVQIVRENLPSVKDNPFILRDRMNLK